jgi:hypothetical protein
VELQSQHWRYQPHRLPFFYNKLISSLRLYRIWTLHSVAESIVTALMRCWKIENKIKSYVEKQKSPQKEVIREVQKVFKETLPGSKEEMKWGAITYSSGKFYVAAMKSCVHVGFAINGLNSDEIALFEGNGRTMRHIKIPAIESIDKASLVRLIRMVDQKALCKTC